MLAKILETFPSVQLAVMRLWHHGQRAAPMGHDMIHVHRALVNARFDDYGTVHPPSM